MLHSAGLENRRQKDKVQAGLQEGGKKRASNLFCRPGSPCRNFGDDESAAPHKNY